MRRKKQKKINFIQVIWDFLKLQVAANILFVSTLMGFLIGDKVLHTPQLPTLIVASIIGNILFFIIDRDWVCLLYTSPSPRQVGNSEIYNFYELEFCFKYSANRILWMGTENYS